MMPETALLENAGRYQRVIDPEGEDSLSALARRIATSSQVLDLGTGPGALGAYLAAEKGCVVDGVDCDPEAASLARGFYRDFFQADLERVRLPELLAGRRYQVIVCADIIEHLRDPGALLRQLPALLEPAGRVLLSVPNVSYCGVLGELLEGKFRYRPSGLLDSTHLRFFTRSSLLELLREHGLHPVRLTAVLQDPDRSEFDTCFNALPPKIQHALLSRPDALSYQFLVEAAAEPSEPVGSGDLEPVPAAWPFVAQLYWRQTGEDFTEAASAGGQRADGGGAADPAFSHPSPGAGGGAAARSGGPAGLSAPLRSAPAGRPAAKPSGNRICGKSLTDLQNAQLLAAGYR